MTEGDCRICTARLQHLPSKTLLIYILQKKPNREILPPQHRFKPEDAMKLRMIFAIACMTAGTTAATLCTGRALSEKSLPLETLAPLVAGISTAAVGATYLLKKPAL